MKIRLGTQLSLTCVSALILLTACGGGSTELTGAVIDGYIEGAKVCLDIDDDGACGDTEPSTFTQANGGYSLDVSSRATAGRSIIAEIPDTAKDSDDAGLTLAAAGKSAYVMATPADQPDVITPLTTLIVGKVKSDSITLAQAKAQVLEQLGLPEGTDPHEDHIAKGNQSVHAAARQVAGQLQQAYASLDPNVAASARWTKLQEALAAAEDNAGTISQVSASALNMPATLGAVATGELFAYQMTGAKGQPIQATAMLFTPKTSAPDGGWPLVVFGHGTTGVGQQCAPSVTMAATGEWDYAGLVALLVNGGFVVVAPDYEGLGNTRMGVAAGHPYLDLRSAGQSMVLAAVAAKKHMPADLSGAWAAIGHSQGGHAALAAGQFSGLAQQLDSSLIYKGAVAVAPASNLLDSLNTMWASITAATSPSAYPQAYLMVGTSSLYTAYLIQGTQSTPNPIEASTLLGSNMLNIYNANVKSECLGAFSTLVTKDVSEYAYGGTQGASPMNYPGVINSAVNSPKVAGALAANEPGQVKVPGKTLLVQGSADTTVWPAMTDKLLATMEAKGSDVSLSYHDSVAATHSGVLIVEQALADIEQHLATLFGTASSAASQ